MTSPSRPRPRGSRRPLVHARILVLVLALALASAWPLAAAAAGRVLSFSDVHFDPFADAALVDELVAADYTAWQGILAKGSAQVATYGKETNYSLLDSSLDQMQSVLADPDFVLMTGDILAHHFREKYQAARPGASEAEIDAFIKKTVTFFADQVHQRFPNASVYFTLGNNDSYRGDYMVAPNGSFLADSSQIFQEYFIGDASERAGFGASYQQLGNYSLTARGEAAIRVLGLNSVLFSVHYQPPAGDTTDYQGQALDWLESALAQAASAGEKVWLLTHVPPGVDVFGTLYNRRNALKHIVETSAMWKEQTADDYVARFSEILSKYSSIIVSTFSGHTHMDDFRLVNAGRAYPGGVVEVHITPAISPQFGNNPGFQIFEYDQASGELRNFTTYYLDVASAATAEKGWRREYDFAGGYRLYGGYDQDILLELVRLLWTDTGMRQSYYDHYAVSSADAPPAAQQPAYVLGISELDTDQWQDVYNEHAPFSAGAYLPASAVGGEGIRLP